MYVPSQIEKMKKTGIRYCGPKRGVRAEYGMHWIKGNRRPYFSITGTTYRLVGGVSFMAGEKQHDITSAALIEDGGGCCHDDIAVAFPELAELIPFHLCDDDGPSMHYVANGTYWALLELGATVGNTRRPVPFTDNSFWEVLKEHALTDQLGDEDKVWIAMHGMAISIANGARKSGIRDFETFLTGRIPAMKVAFDAMMAKHEIEMIEVPGATPACTTS